MNFDYNFMLISVLSSRNDTLLLHCYLLAVHTCSVTCLSFALAQCWLITQTPKFSVIQWAGALSFVSYAVEGEVGNETIAIYSFSSS